MLTDIFLVQYIFLCTYCRPCFVHSLEMGCSLVHAVIVFIQHTVHAVSGCLTHLIVHLTKTHYDVKKKKRTEVFTEKEGFHMYWTLFKDSHCQVRCFSLGAFTSNNALSPAHLHVLGTASWYTDDCSWQVTPFQHMWSNILVPPWSSKPFVCPCPCQEFVLNSLPDGSQCSYFSTGVMWTQPV